MQRSKQQALMFLLGAVLVGGALGFSADRYLGHEKFVVAVRTARQVLRRVGLCRRSSATTLDSLAFEQDCAMRAVFAPHDRCSKSMRTRLPAQRRFSVHERPD